MLLRKMQAACQASPKVAAGLAIAVCSAIIALIVLVFHPVRHPVSDAHKPVPLTENAPHSAVVKTVPVLPSVDAGAVKRQSIVASRHKASPARLSAAHKVAVPSPPHEAASSPTDPPLFAGPEPSTAPTPELPLTPVNPDLAGLHPSAALLIHGPQNVPKVALTFDAGSDAKAVPLILKTLEERHVHATFFLTGQFCEKFPAECRAIADAGMELGNHSYRHPHFTRLSDAHIQEELERAEAAIVKACGRGAKPLFRFPYGDSNARTQRIVAASGYQAIHWTLDSLDAFQKPKTVDFVANRIDTRVKPGYITLMHVSCVTSALALPRIFDQLDQLGAQVVPVSELLLSAPQGGKTHLAGSKERIAQ